MKVTERFFNLFEAGNFSFLDKIIAAGRVASESLPHKIRVGRLKSNFSSQVKKEVLEHNYHLYKTLKNCEKRQERVILAIPSMTFESEDLENIVGIVHYEGRGLWEILSAAQPGTKVIFVTSTPLPEEAKNHLLESLPDAAAVKKRILFLSLNDERREISLIDKILESPKLIEVVRQELKEGISYMCPFISTKAEWELAKKLEIPVYGPHPALEILQTKSKCREVFKKAGIGIIDGAEEIYSCEALAFEILALLKKSPHSKKLMVKLNIGVSGDGNALFRVPEDWDISRLNQAKILEQLPTLEFQADKMTYAKFKRKLQLLGGIVESFIEGEEKTSPSVQFFLHPDGKAECLSTHDQILDQNGMTFLGSLFPASESARKIIAKRGQRIAEILAQMGVVGTVGIDFLQNGNQIYPIEINMRRGGTTHPYQTAKLLTGGKYEPNSGKLALADGSSRLYLSNDNYVALKLKGKNPKELLSFLKQEGLLFSERKAGVVLHLLSALHDHGKFGYTVIGQNRSEIIALDKKLRESLEYFLSRGVA